MLKRVVSKNGLTFVDEYENTILKIAELINGNTLIVKVSGKIAKDVAEAFKNELTTAVLAFKTVILDFTEVDYISGAGFAGLLDIQNDIDAMQGKSLRIKKLTPEIQKSFDNIGYTDMFNIDKE